MRWIPPRSLAAREHWARENRWVAGLYFGLLFSAFMTIWYASMWPGWLAVLAGLLTWPATCVAFAVGIRRRWGQRADPDRYPVPTRKRPWTRASDGLLLFGLVFCIAGGLLWGLGTVTGGENLLVGSVVTVGCVWMGVTAWAERRRRASENEPPEERAR